MRRRHDMAVGLRGVEDALFEVPLDDARISALVAALPEPAREAAGLAHEMAKAEEESCARRMETLRRLDSGGTHTPESLGEAFFLARTHEKPSGIVRVERRGIAFVVFAAKREDYLAMVSDEAARSEVVAGSLGFACPGLWLYGLPEPCSDPEDFGSVLFVCEEPEQGAVATDTPQSIVAHEIQHLVNDKLLGGFHASEQRAGRVFWKRGEAAGRDVSSLMNIEQHVWYLKNELFAFLRGGTPVREIRNHLLHGSYAHAIAAIRDERARLETERAIMDTLGLLDATSFLARPEARRTLIAMLADVPLLEMPKWIRAASEYYAPLLETVRQCRHHPAMRLAVVTMASMVRHGRAAECLLRAHELSALADAVEDRIFSARSDMPVFGKDQLEPSVARLERAWSELERAGVPVTASVQPYRNRRREERVLTERESAFVDAVLAGLDAISQGILSAAGGTVNSESATPFSRNAVEDALAPVRSAVASLGARCALGEGRMAVRMSGDGSVQLALRVYPDSQDDSFYIGLSAEIPASVDVTK